MSAQVRIGQSTPGIPNDCSSDSGPSVGLRAVPHSPVGFQYSSMPCRKPRRLHGAPRLGDGRHRQDALLVLVLVLRRPVVRTDEH